jgi:hypothetical protein
MAQNLRNNGTLGALRSHQPMNRTSLMKLSGYIGSSSSPGSGEDWEGSGVFSGEGISSLFNAGVVGFVDSDAIISEDGGPEISTCSALRETIIKEGVFRCN